METSMATYLVYLLGAACCCGWMFFTLADRGSHPSTSTAVFFFVVLLLLAGGFGYSFLRLSKRSRWNQMSMFIQIGTLMGVSGSFAWQLGFSDESVFIAAMFGGVALVAGLYWYASCLDKK